ncbi:MAG: Gfo/Idh/MocA family oxidoreductase [Acidobacteriota bacterium]|nr:MAG: Gfo/Idh/MocA family oxidoreductase [Acidobacteriota bacterium]
MEPRREFLKKTSVSVAAAAAVSQFPFIRSVHGASDLEIKIGLIGCGGRGTGAVLDAVGAATKVIYPQSGYHTEDVAEGASIERENIQVLALADLFEDRLTRSREQLQKIGIEVPKTHCFTGIDAYKEVLADPNINYVILATPPHFRPTHLLAAIEAGKHAFIEKPAAVDAPGVRMIMEAGRLAEEKGLGIVAGTQRRHQRSYQETIRRIHDGAVGDIVYAKCYWNGGQIWVIDRQAGWSDMEWQLRNWNYFTWLSGDHIVEQHVHNLDVMNWVLGTHPIRAISGLGGRQVRTGERHGHIFDHFAVEYEYPGGVSMFSQCRQINGCQNIVAEEVVGSKGTTNCRDRILPREGERWRYRQRDGSPYQLEHEDLIESIRQGKPLNEAQAVAESTMTGIIGREAVYSGQAVEWDKAMQSEARLGPDKYDLGAYPIPEIAMPGTYKLS